MMRSLYSGVSGLQNHQTRMDVIGNNISNVNTVGFKKGRVGFQDMISQTMSGAARPNAERGGVNGKQVGLGMSVAAIDNLHTQGSLQSTGVKTDLAITGDGYFILKKGDSQFYTRAGNFNVDAAGNFVNPANGFKVQGWAAQEINGETLLVTAGPTTDLNIPIGGKDPAKATTVVELASNLGKNFPIIPPNATPAQIAEGTWPVDQKIYDSFGNPHTLRMDFTRSLDGAGNAIPNQWDVAVSIDPAGTEFFDPTAAPANPILAVGQDPAAGDANTFTVNFDNNGSLSSITDGQGNALNADTLSAQLTFDTPFATNPDPLTGDNPTQQTITIDIGEVGDFSDSITQSASPVNTTKSLRQDGFGMGYLTDFNIDTSGIITGVYDNGNLKTLGQVAMASFVNPRGLDKAGDTNFVETINSGQANVGPAGSQGKGSIKAGFHEMSNVDLSAEFVDMIVTQRGFQSNSKTIQTSDQLLQELLQLKR